MVGFCPSVGLSVCLSIVPVTRARCMLSSYLFRNKDKKKGGQQAKPGQGKFQRKPKDFSQKKGQKRTHTDTASVASSGTGKSSSAFNKKQKR